MLTDSLHNIRTALAQQFADGITDGFEIALTLALGRASSGAQPYAGPPLPDEFVEWAEGILAKLAESKKDMAAEVAAEVARRG